MIESVKYLISLEDKKTGLPILKQPFTVVAKLGFSDIKGITSLAIRTFLKEYDLSKNDIRIAPISRKTIWKN